MDLLTKTRNSRMELEKVYFWTNTIYNWKHLLKQNKYKLLLIETLKSLVDNKKILVYGFVIMPNHMHIIWELISMNGKEMPHASFNKATAHLIIKDLKENSSSVLSQFNVNEKERSYRIWRRDPLAIILDSEEKLIQKLIYIHNNPLNKGWNLSESPETYKWSSANFYETGNDDFGFITHFSERI